MKRIPFKICILLVLILGIGVILLGIYKTDSLNISDLDKQEKISKIVEFYDFKWGPTDYDNKNNIINIKEKEKQEFTSNSKFPSTSRNIRSSDDHSENNEEEEEEENNVIIVNKEQQRVHTCESTVQGSLYIADDQGYVCLRSHWDSVTKCCNTNITTTTTTKTNSQDKDKETTIHRYSCKRCNGDCCNSYEFCISCCMRPDKISILHDTLIDFAEKGLDKQYLRNQYQLCQMACRTSSSSLLNQREYQNPEYKYCYSSPKPVTQPPNTVAVNNNKNINNNGNE